MLVEVAIEVKATNKVVNSDLRGLKAIEEENLLSAYVLVSQDPHSRKEGNILIIGVEEFLERLWNHDSFKKL